MDDLNPTPNPGPWKTRILKLTLTLTLTLTLPLTLTLTLSLSLSLGLTLSLSRTLSRTLALTLTVPLTLAKVSWLLLLSTITVVEDAYQLWNYIVAYKMYRIGLGVTEGVTVRVRCSVASRCAEDKC